eukprot:SAG31_NODE_635_length_13360_cov_4.229847_3_plen_65_part_00
MRSATSVQAPDYGNHGADAEVAADVAALHDDEGESSLNCWQVLHFTFEAAVKLVLEVFGAGGAV